MINIIKSCFIYHIFFCAFCHSNILKYLKNPIDKRLYWRISKAGDIKHFYNSKYPRHFTDNTLKYIKKTLDK